MALDTYANLKASIIDWSHRNDISDALVNDFIDMAESSMWRLLELRSMEARANPTTEPTTRFIALPTDYIKMRRLKLSINNEHKDIRYSTPESMAVINTSGQPKYFTVTSQIEFDRVPAGTYTTEIQYYKKLTALSGSNTTNSVLTNHPSIYLFGSLWNLNNWSNNDLMAVKYEALFLTAINDANKMDKKGRYGPASGMRTEGSKP